MAKKTIKRQSLTEQIKTILTERIISGSLQPGDRLKELPIAEEFGTSQAPVREAIRSLQALGYLEHKSHVGAVVRMFTKKEVEEAYQIREALEAHSLITAKIEVPKLADKLKQQLDRMQQAYEENSATLFIDADNEFHTAIIECSGNKRMLEIWRSLGMQLQVITMLTETHIPLDKLYDLHSPIVGALQQNHREGSARYLANHYRQTGVYWKTLQ